MTAAPLSLFQGFGVELEYMLVDADTLSVAPVCDRILEKLGGDFESEIERGDLAWSNELVLHVIELKTNGPAARLDNLANMFHADVREIAELAQDFGAILMPTAMHPWMDPHTETRLWPHEYSPVYQAFNRIFDCRGHGWSNLQSTHLNLPFATDEEFARLHAAIRLVLPILPALAASSPICDAADTTVADARLEAYRHNADRIPSVAGAVIPEPVFTRKDYESVILERIFRDLAPHDPDGVLRYEWANARGAIARFDRGAIEIRVLDVQECPAADLAMLTLIVETIRGLTEARWTSLDTQKDWPVDRLTPILLQTIRHGDLAQIDDPDYLEQFSLPSSRSVSAGDLWRHLFEMLFPMDMQRAPHLAPLETILTRGCLSRRIRRALDLADVAAPIASATTPLSHNQISATYRQLCTCLLENQMFDA